MEEKSFSRSGRCAARAFVKSSCEAGGSWAQTEAGRIPGASASGETGWRQASYMAWRIAEAEAIFAFSDRSDSNDSTYLHFQNKYESAIQTDGKKYVFVSIRECDRPLAEMQLAADMDVWCFQKPSLSNQLTGACADFGITDELPESVRQIMDSTVTGS